MRGLSIAVDSNYFCCNTYNRSRNVGTTSHSTEAVENTANSASTSGVCDDVALIYLRRMLASAPRTSLPLRGPIIPSK